MTPFDFVPVDPVELTDPRALPSHLREVVGEATVYTVTDLYNGIVRRVQAWGEPWVVGELTDLKPRNGGHLACSLRDDGGKLDLFIHARVLAALGFELEHGLGVLVRFRFDVYPQTGKLQGRVVDLVPRDKGPRQLAFEQAVARLREEGLLDPARKRALPRFPQRIGIITSSRGKVVDDLVTNLLRRRPRLSIKIWSATVQGEEAVGDLLRGIRGFNKHLPETDVLVVGRGGGSIDDLWAFNDEQLARAIAGSAIPVVVSLGHTSDRSLAGLVADLDAATPSTAAELVTALDEETVLRCFTSYEARLTTALRRKRDELAGRVHALERRRVFDDLACLTERAHDRLERLEHRLPRAGAALTLEARHRIAGVERDLGDGMRARSADARRRFEHARIRLHGASPLALLERGYSVVERASDGRTVRAPEDVTTGDAVRIRTHGGDIDCEVTG